jgi:biopolymer transport protein ExbB
MNTFLEQLEHLWGQASSIWLSGGWCMLPIALTALILFGLGVHMQLQLREKAYTSVPESTWRRWIHDGAARRGPIGELLDFVTGGASLAHMAVAFEEVRVTEIAPFERNLRVMKVCIAAAPLLGLLGTVTGMLATFQALSTGSGGEQTMGLVAKGISEALITTETGLVVALPGVFFQYQLARRYEGYKTFLAHLETVCTQNLYRSLRRQAAAS